VVSDAGLLSEENRKELEGNGYQYILGVGIKNSKMILKEQILSFNLKNGEAKSIR
jgi:hypothetical protein